ncbi:putative NRPS-like enzyme [Saccharata proteae CBS 121410]|uniref:NRPS-like enzyme n=1 Tax=Saccharata proteae CBS 121410 TaxID=1314787 RepID=A0A9P4HW25_9PEZI|nr:putative NRPS-like enzyme [Saccharata proteae CBS 121410]
MLSVEQRPADAPLLDSGANSIHKAGVNETDTHSKQPSEPRTIDELLRSRALSDPDLPLIAYPSSAIEYVNYTARQLDMFAFRAAKHYKSKIPQRPSSDEVPTVIGLLGPSNLDYVVTMLALSKLGHTVLFMSTRIMHEAYASLLASTGSRHMVVDPTCSKVASALQNDDPALKVVEIAGAEIYNQPMEETLDTQMDQALDADAEADNVAWIIHSSGSTGLPKPIYQTHKAALKNYAGNMNMRGFITLPIYHNHGISCFFRAIHSKKTLHLYNASLPLAKQYLMDIIRSHDFEIFYGVPYVLGLLGETIEGIELLSGFKIVMFGGSACPDSLGHRLVEHGVNLVGHYGSTETGQLMTSFRPPGDKDWDYLRVSDVVRPYLRFEDRGGGLYELICLPGWPSKVMSNREDDSYALKDCFTKHPSTPDAWKYYCRLDDTLTLNNGEKANPLKLEGAARQSQFVSEAVVFGVGQSSLGLALVRAPEAATFPDETILDDVFRVIEPAHAVLPAYAKIERDKVLILDPETAIRVTDKGTVIRRAFYDQFREEINAVYEKTCSGALVLGEPELKELIRDEVTKMMQIPKSIEVGDDQDFFNLGMDSLQSISLRTTLVSTLDLNGKSPGLNCVFDFPSVAALAHHLIQLRAGTDRDETSKEDEMQKLINEYACFNQHEPCPRTSRENHVIVTGATGSLGAHVVAQIASRPDVNRIWCLVRASSQTSAQERVIRSMVDRRVWDGLSASAQEKIAALPSDLSHPDLGLSLPALQEIQAHLTSIIHCAWSVNFNLQLRSFARDCIASITNLINLCLSTKSPTPATFNFCSSISTVMGTPTTTTTVPTTITESLPARLSHAQKMGYAQSKLVAEHICMCAVASTNIPARVLRIGQVIGDTRHGIWNTTEAIPLMLQSAVTSVGALPTLDEDLRWLPVDVVAATTAEIALNKEAPGRIYNIVNPETLHWTEHLLPALRTAGMRFEEVPVGEWLRRLKGSERDPERNPPIKLVGFFEGKYGGGKEGRRGFVCETLAARTWSGTMDGVGRPDGEVLGRIARFFLDVGWRNDQG